MKLCKGHAMPSIAFGQLPHHIQCEVFQQARWSASRQFYCVCDSGCLNDEQVPEVPHIKVCGMNMCFVSSLPTSLRVPAGASREDNTHISIFINVYGTRLLPLLSSAPTPCVRTTLCAGGAQGQSGDSPGGPSPQPSNGCARPA